MSQLTLNQRLATLQPQVDLNLFESSLDYRNKILCLLAEQEQTLATINKEEIISKKWSLIPNLFVCYNEIDSLMKSALLDEDQSKNLEKILVFQTTASCVRCLPRTQTILRVLFVRNLSPANGPPSIIIDLLQKFPLSRPM